MIFLLFSAFAGVLLRYYNLSLITGMVYRNVVHGHSHVAMLGWLHLGFTTILIREFIGDDWREFVWVQLLTLAAVVGMMLSFPFEGYGLFSISFSTIFIFATYIFTYKFLRHPKVAGNKSLALSWARWSLAYLVLSSLGPWTLGPLMVLGDDIGDLYNLAVYFYLHFAYNGFFVLVLFSILQRTLEKAAVSYSQKGANWFYGLTAGAVIPAYALSTLWIEPPVWVYFVGAGAAVAQLIGLILGRGVIRNFIGFQSNRWLRALFVIVFVSYSTKLILQLLSVFPSIEEFVYDFRLFVVIGYIHMVMLGIFSLFLIAYLLAIGIFRSTIFSRMGIIIFLTGLILSEVTLFGNGLMLLVEERFLPAYPKLILFTSLLMPLGLLFFFIVQVGNKVGNVNSVNASET